MSKDPSPPDTIAVGDSFVGGPTHNLMAMANSTYSTASTDTGPIDVRFLLLVFITAACSRSASPSDGGSDTATAASVPAISVSASPTLGTVADRVLQLAYSDPGGAMLPPLLQVCPVRGTLMICGEEHLYVHRDGALVPDPAREAGLPHAPGGSLSVELVVHGSWPDNAWAVCTRMADGPPFLTTVYHWRRDRWITAIPGRRTWDEVRAIIPWGGTGAALLQSVELSKDAWFVGLGSRAGKTLEDGWVGSFDRNTIIVVTKARDALETPVLRLWAATSTGPVFAADLSKTVAEGTAIVVEGSLP